MRPHLAKKQAVHFIIWKHAARTSLVGCYVRRSGPACTSLRAFAEIASYRPKLFYCTCGHDHEQSLTYVVYCRSNGKDALRQLHALFSTSSPTSTFPSLSLPPTAIKLLDGYIVNFASSSPSTTVDSSSASLDRDKERARFRDSLLELWRTIVEPAPGSEGDPGDIARVSAFLVLLGKLSADCQDDDDSAVVSRNDIGKVWWDAVLRRVLLGTAKDGVTEDASAVKDRGRRSHAKPSKPRVNAAQQRPLTVSRQALEATHKMVVWAMSPSLADLDEDQNFVPPFCITVAREFEQRSVAAMRGGDEWYGLRNVAECMWAWAEKSTQVSRRPIKAFRCASSLHAHRHFLSARHRTLTQQHRHACHFYLFF